MAQESITVTKSETVDCPFCKGIVTVALEPEEARSIMHTMPMCKTFEESDPLDFFKQLNAALEGI